MGKCFDATALSKEDTIRLNEIAEENKEKYTEFVDKYSKLYGKDKMWWALPFTSRDIWLDDTFQTICLFLLCTEVMAARKYVSILVPDIGICRALRSYCKEEGLKIEITISDDSSQRVLKRFIKRFIGETKRLYEIRKVVREIRYNFKEPIVLINTPILSSSICEGKYYDRYFSNIQNYAKENLFFLTSLNRNTEISWREFVGKLINIKEYNFVFKEYYLRLYDMMVMWRYYLFCNKMARKRYVYMNCDVSSIVQKSILSGIICAPSYKGLLDEIAIRRMRKKGVIIKNLIVWYEGRPSDIIISKAYRKNYSEGRCIGYEGFPLLEFWLSLFISEEQNEQKAAPEMIAVPGKAYLEWSKQFCSKLKVICVPVLRNDYRQVVQKENGSSSGRKSVLLVLSYFLDVNAEMIEFVNRFCKENPAEQINVMVKNHPVNEGKEIDFYYQKPVYFQPVYVTGSLMECLKQADVAFLCQSTSSMEILCSHTYLIALCPLGELREIAITPEVNSGLYSVVYDYTDFENALTEGLNSSVTESDLGRDIDYFFEEINEKNVGRLFY